MAVPAPTATIYRRRRTAAAIGLLGVAAIIAHPVTSLVFANLAALVGATQQTGVTSSSLTARLMPDLRQITGIGLTSTRGASDSTTQVTVAVKP